MSAFKSILLHLDASVHCANRLAVAGELASQHDGAVTALFAVASTTLAGPGILSEGSAVFAMASDIDTERRERARRAFDAAHPGPRIHWAELNAVDVVAGFVRHAYVADLLVLGQRDPAQPAGDGVPADFVESVVIDSGRPAIVVPYAGDFARVGQRALVAWKPTREAARALSAALPLLERAQRVHVISWGEDPQAVDGLLRRHGIDARWHREGRASSDLGEHLLSRAADLEADLLVMGCYGHSRAREMVLSGASRTVLSSMTLPVLMAH